LTHPVDFHSLL